MTHRILLASAMIWVSLLGLGVQNTVSGQDGSSTVGDSREMPKKQMIACANTDLQSTVDAAYSWLVKQQQADGSWSLVKPYGNGGQTENRVAATRALTACVDLQRNDSSGWRASRQRESRTRLARGPAGEKGYFFHRSNVPSHHQAYSQAFASLVICELYSLTKMKRFAPPRS